MTNWDWHFPGGEVAYLLLSEPYKTLQLINTTVNLALKGEKCLKGGQINSTLRVKLPLLPSIVNSSDTSRIPSNGLFVMKGILVAHTLLTKYW